MEPSDIPSKLSNSVNHPQHYNKLRIECIDVVENMNFCIGNAIKYLWRCEDKSNAIEDLKKSIWYIEREIAKRSKCE
jgi:hypothetical protein